MLRQGQNMNIRPRIERESSQPALPGSSRHIRKACKIVIVPAPQYKILGIRGHGGHMQRNRFSFKQLTKTIKITCHNRLAHMGQYSLQFTLTGLVVGASVGQGVTGRRANVLFFLRHNRYHINQIPMVSGSQWLSI